MSMPTEIKKMAAKTFFSGIFLTIKNKMPASKDFDDFETKFVYFETHSRFLNPS